MQSNLPATLVDLADVRSDLMSPHDRDINRYPALSSLRRVGAADHYQFDFANAFAQGRGEYCAVTRSMYVQCFDAELADPYRLVVLGPDTLRIRIASAGSCRYWGELGTESVVSGPMLTLIAEPPGMQPAHFVAEDRQRVAHVYLHRSELASLYSGAEKDLPPPIQAFLRGELCATYIHTATPPAELLDCVSALLNCSLEGRGRWLFFRSKALEIICRAFDSIGATDCEPAYGLSVPAQRAIAKARRILEQEFTHPPALDVLARTVGLSRTVMCSGFRILTGKSVYEHVTEIRMQQALVLLGKPGARVADVAHALGYQHASSFTAAVRKFFGTHPRALRRHSCGSNFRLGAGES